VTILNDDAGLRGTRRRLPLPIGTRRCAELSPLFNGISQTSPIVNDDPMRTTRRRPPHPTCGPRLQVCFRRSLFSREITTHQRHPSLSSRTSCLFQNTTSRYVFMLRHALHFIRKTETRATPVGPPLARFSNNTDLKFRSRLAVMLLEPATVTQRSGRFATNPTPLAVETHLYPFLLPRACFPQHRTPMPRRQQLAFEVDLDSCKRLAKACCRPHSQR